MTPVNKLLGNPVKALVGEVRNELAKVENAVSSTAGKVASTLADTFSARPDPLQPAMGPARDPTTEIKNWASDKLFEALRPRGEASALKGTERVAYGPLEAPPILQRPTVMIPGLTMSASSFDTAAKQLATQPANGPVVVYVAAEDTFRLGSAHGPEASTAELKQSKIFEVEYADPWAAPTVKAPQLERAFARISSVTGQGTVDTVTHSAGGTDLRLYLARRSAGSGPKLGRAVMIGPASHGTEIGNLAAISQVSPKNVDDAGRELAIGSPLITSLNADWAKQRAQIGEVTIVGVGGAPTLGPAKGLFEDGDGYMPIAQLAMPDTQLVTMKGPHQTPLAHLWEVQYAGVVNAVFDALK